MITNLLPLSSLFLPPHPHPRYVFFAAFVRQSDLPLYLFAMDVFVMPSMMRSETFGIVGIEVRYGMVQRVEWR